MRDRKRVAALMCALILGVSLSGCGLSVHLPTQTTAHSHLDLTRTDRAPAVSDNEVRTPPGPLEHVTPASSAVTALRHFGATYINWTASDVARKLRTLASHSVGQARSALTLQASQTAADPELTQAGIANHGTVEAVAALGHGRYVVVTREATTATDSSSYQGLAAAWHLTVATVARRDGGWVISGWRPEN